MQITFKKGVDSKISKFIATLMAAGFRVEWPPEIRIEVQEIKILGRLTPTILNTFWADIRVRIPETMIEIHKDVDKS